MYPVDSIELPGGYRAEVFEDRDDGLEPWKEFDGHGVVSEFVNREKRPGERALVTVRGRSMFYDVAATMEIAKRDCWGAPRAGETRGQRAARAVAEDFEHLRGFCNDEWCYLVLRVDVYRGDEKIGEDVLGGVESLNGWPQECARDMAECLAQDDAQKRRNGWRAALRELRQRREWEARDVMTAV